LGSLPFIGLQSTLNLGTTGTLLRTPYQYYVDRYQPKVTIGFHSDSEIGKPDTRIPEKLDYYNNWMWPEVQKHQVKNLPRMFASRVSETLSAALPSTLFILFIPLILLRIREQKLLILTSAASLFFLLYFFNTFYLVHYRIILIPIILTFVAVGQQIVGRIFPKFEKKIFSAIFCLNLIIFFWMTPTLNSLVKDSSSEYPMARYVHEQMPKEIVPNSIVFFKYQTGNSVDDEPVYNETVLWPDDASIIRVHARDLTGNRDTIEYYSKLQPARTVYTYDRTTRTLKQLGNVKEIADQNRELEIPVWNITN